MRTLEYIWSINEHRLSKTNRWILRALKRGVITYECVMNNNITSYASALTYSSSLAAVPIMAIIVAIARGFGFEAIIEERVRVSLSANPELADTIMHFVDQYLQHTRGGVFIGVGLIFLLYTIISLTTNIETAFNTIWLVNRSRSITRQIVNYISVFVLLPFILIISSGIGFVFQSLRQSFPDSQMLDTTLVHLLQIFPNFFVCLIFVLLFKLMPNTHVRMRSALWPGIATGICFLVVQYFYIHYQIKLSAYNAIYGSFAAIPLFMLWMQISWCICLIGGQLSYAEQSLDHYAFERSSKQLSRRYRDTIGLLLLSRICKRFAAGSVPYTVRTLAKDCDLPENLVQNLLSEFVDMQLVAKTHDESGHVSYFLPAVDINRMTTQMVQRRMDSYGTENTSRVWQTNTKEWPLLRKLRNEGENQLLVDI